MMKSPRFGFESRLLFLPNSRSTRVFFHFTDCGIVSVRVTLKTRCVEKTQPAAMGVGSVLQTFTERPAPNTGKPTLSHPKQLPSLKGEANHQIGLLMKECFV